MSGCLAMGIYHLGRIRFLYPLYRVLHEVLVKTLLGAAFPATAEIASGLILPHGANGIIIHHQAQIGADVTIYQQVTIGDRVVRGPAPVIGASVIIGAGAKILGPVVLGSCCRIGANAVVLQNVPAWATAVGVPARIILPQ